MAVVRRTKNADGTADVTSSRLKKTAASGKASTKVKLKTSKSPVIVPADDWDASLPDTKSDIISQFTQIRGLMYGEKKIGKTTLLSQQPETLFLMFEPGARAISVYQKVVQCWEHFLAIMDNLENDSRYLAVVVDTADRFHEMFYNWFCDAREIDAPAEANDWGVTTSRYRRDFTDAVERLLRLDKGVWFTSHASIKEINRRDGYTWKQLRCTLPKTPFEIIEGLVDMVAYYGYDGSDRILVIRGDEMVDAGTRLDSNFKTPGGRLVNTIPMGSSKSEAFANFMKAFQNRQLKSGSVPYVQTVKPQKSKK